MIYLNNAATSYPKPDCVCASVSAALKNMPGAAHRGGIEDFDVFDEVRRLVAPLLGVSEHEQIALGANASWALNLAIFGFPLNGGRVLTTKAEHNSVLRPLFSLENEKKCSVVYLDVDETGRISPEKWRAALLEHRPALCVFSHASNVTGAVNDAKALCAAAKEQGSAVLMDASQTLGLKTLEAEKWGADMVAFTGHKYLLGSQGTGGLWVRPGLELRPHLVGGTGIMSDLETMPDIMPLHLEAGTGNEPGFHGLLAALRWAGENPLDERAMLEKLYKLRRGLAALGARVIAPTGDVTPVLSFTLPGISCAEAAYELSEGCGIVCRTGLHCAPKIFPCLGVPETIRLSLSRFTDDGEVEEAIEAVGSVVNGI